MTNILIWTVFAAGLVLIYIKRKGGRVFPNFSKINLPAVNYRIIGLLIGGVAASSLVIVLKPWIWLLNISSGELIWWGLVILIFSLSFAEKVIPKKWSYIPVALGATLIVAGVYTSGFASWTSRTYENVVEKCLGEQDCSDPVDQTASVKTEPTVREIDKIRAKDDGMTHFIIAPWDKEVTLTYPTNRCVYYWSKESGNKHDIWTKPVHRIEDGIAARTFISNTGKPEKVYYQVGKRESGGCPDSI